MLVDLWTNVLAGVAAVALAAELFDRSEQLTVLQQLGLLAFGLLVLNALAAVVTGG